ncbi:hypothetical protein VTL71DRAFT_14914 [Oculimacula yallundae]|uniref:Uncharacterized protein n=1 Tax=Oculimacula yallundae TaxID=86028 RepID=A0ABR4CFW0_9HELO
MALSNTESGAGKDQENCEMSDGENEDMDISTQEFNLAFRPGPNALPSPIHISPTPSAQTDTANMQCSAISNADQVAFGRSLEKYYREFEDWEEECHQLTTRYKRDFRAYTREYIGFYDEKGWNFEGPVPYLPQEPVLPPKPEIPTPPSRTLRTLVESAKTSQNRMVMNIHYGGHNRRVGVVSGRVRAFIKKKSAREGITKKSVVSAKRTNSRSDAVGRALATMDVNVPKPQRKWRTGGAFAVMFRKPHHAAKAQLEVGDDDVYQQG